MLIQPLGPALILVLSGLAIRWGRELKHRFSPVPLAGARHAIAQDTSPSGRVFALATGNLIALVSVLAATYLLVWLRLHPGHSMLRWGWQPLTVAGSTLDWQLDVWSWLVSLLLLMLVATMLLLRPVEAGPAGSADTDERTLWLGAAALVFVSSGNIVTLASSWILLDAALAYRLRPDRAAAPAARSFGVSSIAALILFGVFCLMGESGSRTLLSVGPFTTLQIGLLWIIGLVRAGIYPFHLGLVSDGRSGVSDHLALNLVGSTTGLWLLARIHAVSAVEWFRRPEWAALGVLALLGTALAAWTAEDDSRRWQWVVMNRAGLAVLAAYMGEAVGAAMLVWSLVTLALGGALLAGIRLGGLGRVWRVAGWLGALALWGIPGTPGFMARSVLVLPTLLRGAIPLFAVIVVAETLLVAALWELVRTRRNVASMADDRSLDAADQPSWAKHARSVAAVVLLSLPLLLWGVIPRQLASSVGVTAHDTFPSLVQFVLATRRSVWASLLLSGVFGVILGVFRRPLLAGMRGWQRAISGFVSLNWLYRSFAAGLALIGSGLRFFATLGEGEGYLGWMALGCLVLWVLLHA